MKLPLVLLAVSLSLGLLVGLAAAPPEKTVKPVRLRFVPVAHDGNRASSSELHPFPEPDSMREAVQAWAGLGDSFPVREKGGKALFEVAVVTGDDNRLEIELRETGAVQKVSLPRDQRVTARVGGREYEFVYLSVSGNPADRMTTDQAMIIVSRAR